MQVRSAAVLAAASGNALAAPAAARAATVSVPGTCFISSQPIAITGSGFTPGGPVTISGGVFGSTVADGAGNIAASVSALFVGTIAPKRVAVTVTDATNPANRTGAFVPVIRGLLVTNAPVSGRPRQKTTWRFAGFPPGTAIYGH